MTNRASSNLNEIIPSLSQSDLWCLLVTMENGQTKHKEFKGELNQIEIAALEPCLSACFFGGLAIK